MILCTSLATAFPLWYCKSAVSFHQNILILLHDHIASILETLVILGLLLFVPCLALWQTMHYFLFTGYSSSIRIASAPSLPNKGSPFLADICSMRKVIMDSTKFFFNRHSILPLFTCLVHFRRAIKHLW